MKKIILGLVLAMIGMNADASTSLGTIPFSLTLVSTATIDATDLSNAVSFGSVSTVPPILPIDRVGIVLVTMSNGTPYSVGFDAGQHWQSGIRYMMHPNNSSSISYELLYSGSDVGDDGIIGYTATTPGVNGLVGLFVGDGTAQPISITARANMNTADGTTGTYTDTVQITVVW